MFKLNHTYSHRTRFIFNSLELLNSGQTDTILYSLLDQNTQISDVLQYELLSKASCTVLSHGNCESGNIS